MALPVIEEFWNIYNNEWQDVRESLKKERNGEEIIYQLMRIVRGVYDMCLEEVNTSKDFFKSKDSNDIEEIFQDYLQTRLPKSFDKDQLSIQVRLFIRRCLETIFTLLSTEKAPYIYWIPKGEIIDREKFDVEGHKDETVCDWTVWPAVIAQDGTVLRKGIVISV